MAKKQSPTGKPALTAARQAELAAAFLAGANMEDLAVQFRIGKATVHRILKRLGVDASMRPAGQADPAAIDAFAALGAPPAAKPLEAAAWLHRLLLTAVSRASLDPELSEKQRRREIAQLARAAVAAFPFALVEEASS